MNNQTTFLMLCIIVILEISFGSKLQSCVALQRIARQTKVVEEAAILRLRGGEAVTIGKKRKQKLSFPFLVKAFFTSMVDPTYSGQLDIPKLTKGKGSKGKKGAKEATGPFGVAGVTGGASFGPVCGPNGCG